jgi:hypothetical protein
MDEDEGMQMDVRESDAAIANCIRSISTAVAAALDDVGGESNTTQTFTVRLPVPCGPAAQTRQEGVDQLHGGALHEEQLTQIATGFTCIIDQLLDEVTAASLQISVCCASYHCLLMWADILLLLHRQPFEPILPLPPSPALNERCALFIPLLYLRVRHPHSTPPLFTG